MSEEEQLGQLVLVMGDFHIPQRCSEIPSQYREMILPNKVSSVLCTGNVGCREIFDWSKSLSPNFHIVKGQFEDQSYTQLPQEKVVEVTGIKVGLIHGHQIIPWGDEQALANKAKQMGVNILIYGHGHETKFTEHNNKFLINPGSMTGAYTSLKLDATPSFMIMQFRSHEVVIYSYSLVDGEVKCVDSKFTKPKN